MLGFLMVARHKYTDLYTVCPPQTSRFLVVWAIACVPLTYFKIFHVANIAHFSGLGLGMMMAQALYARKARTLWRVGLAAALLITLVLMFYAPWAPGYQLNQDSNWWPQVLRARYPDAL